MSAAAKGVAERVLAGMEIVQSLTPRADGPPSVSGSFNDFLGVLGTSTGALFLFDEAGDDLRPVFLRGPKAVDSIELTEPARLELSRLNAIVEGGAPSRKLSRLNKLLVSMGFSRWRSITSGTDLLGVIALGDSDAETADATQVLEILVRYLGLRISSCQLTDQTRTTTFELNRKELELATVHDASLTLSSSLQVHDVTQEILELAVGVVDGRAGFLFLKHDRSGRLELAHQLGLDDRRDMLGLSKLRRHIRRVMRERVTAELDASSLSEGAAESGAIIAPVGDVGCIGVIDKESRTGTQPFGEADMRLLGLIGQQAGAALSNARLYRDIVEIKNQNENILSSIGNGVISTDLKGRVAHFNPSVTRIFGERSPEAGKSCARFFDGLGCDAIARAVALSLKDGESRQVEGEEVEGVGVMLDCRITPLADEAGGVLGIVVTLEDLTEEMRVRSMFRQYASDQVVDLLLTDKSTPALGGEEREVTVLFVDIRQSTTLLSRIGPEGMVSLLNDCFERMNEIIFEHNGTLDKYTGDGFMVVYGAPVSFPDDTDRAVQTAVEMQKELARFNRDKVEPLPLAFGLSRGRVVAGNVGSLRRMEYTCIGPGVVRASRLCDAAEGGEILIDESVFEALTSKHKVEPLGWQRFKGVDPIQVYRVAGKRSKASPKKSQSKKASATGERFVDLAIPMLPEMELAATKTAEAIATFAGLAEDRTEEVKLALIEACINAFEHSSSKDQVVRINFKLDDDALTIIISDSGKGFDVTGARRKVAARREQGVATRGWGLRIMEELMDDVRIESGDKGTIITLVKQRSG
jgi:PAS domain S-box-containing protein